MATGRIVVNTDRCKGCELCRTACPPDVIVLAEWLNARGYRPALLFDPDHKCTGCALCAVVCPEACITVFRDVRPSRPPSRTASTRAGPTTMDKNVGAMAALPRA